MAQRDSKTGQFKRNENRWEIKDGLLYCYYNDELLFFTEAKWWDRFKGTTVSKYANGYASVRVDGKPIQVHRYLIGAKEGDIIDHINRNKKDNRLSNLRFSDKSENSFNRDADAHNTSGRRGVWFRKDNNRWVAEIKKDNKKISLGCYATKEEAIKAREEGEIKYYGYKLTQ